MGSKMRDRFDKCKVVFFDFDRTLCAHDYVRSGTTYKLYYNELAHQAEVHENDRPIPCMQWLVERARQNGCTLVCLSHTTTNLRDELNKNFLSRYYGSDISYITVSSSDKKVEMMDAYCDANGLDKALCAIVEDRMDTLEQAEVSGFVGVHISNAAMWYENA